MGLNQSLRKIVRGGGSKNHFKYMNQEELNEEQAERLSEESCAFAAELADDCLSNL
jgi:hypothetical protein